MFSRTYSLYQSRKILHRCYNWYKKHWQRLTPHDLSSFESEMASLDSALQNQEAANAETHARKLETFTKTTLTKTFADHFKELVFALLFAFIIAVVVRQVWFELYEIPTGSMRPTFKEKDHLLVTKTTFGINTPLQTDHLYFDPNLVQRTSVFIFSGDNIPFIDSNTNYFGVIPYKKRYIKRCMGKPGDSLYFYGGKLFGFDSAGNDVSEVYNAPWQKNLEYLPFTNFEGRINVSTPKNPLIQNLVTFNFFNFPIGRLLFRESGEMVGEIYAEKQWSKESKISYSDFFGIRNFAMGRLLTKRQVQELTQLDLTGIEEGILYLELRHQPNLTNPKPKLVHDHQNRLSLVLTPFTTIIPLQQHHLDVLMKHMYTARFEVENGRAKRYAIENPPFHSSNPDFPNIPNGCYEFYYGKAYKILWTGIASELPPDHPLYQTTPEHVQKLYNLGIEFSKLFDPSPRNQLFFPSRYAYFRDGDLYVLGAPLLSKEDPTLIAFNEKEEQRQKESTSTNPYTAFKDYGRPFVDGKLDVAFIKKYGVTIPEKSYLALGDNHAMSSDSRTFGFVPEDNLQGSPSLILWPPGHRWGVPSQKPYPWISPGTVIVWSIFIIVASGAYFWYRRSINRTRYVKLSK